MSLVAELARELDDASLSVDQQAMLRCHAACELETAGDYEAARISLGELWQGLGKRPLLAGLRPEVAAEVMLRTGSLSGWIGSSLKVDGANEAAKNLILESAAAFAELGAVEKVAEANIALAACYCREGLFDKARATLQDVLTNCGQDQPELKARALLSMATLEGAAGHLADALQMLTDAAPLCDESGHQNLVGSFDAAITTLLKNLGEQSGNVRSAGLAALTFLEELGDEISLESKFALYQFADRTLGETTSLEILERLRTSARQSLKAGFSSAEGFESESPTESRQIFASVPDQGSLAVKTEEASWQKPAEPGIVEPWAGCSLEEEVRKFEGELIKRALDSSRGSVTRAAKLLGITHQGLAFILQGRHKSLLSSRTPARPRRRSVMRPASPKSKKKKQ